MRNTTTQGPLRQRRHTMFIIIMILLISSCLIIARISFHHYYFVRPCVQKDTTPSATTIVAQTYKSSSEDIACLVEQSNRYNCQLLLLEKGGCEYETPPGVTTLHIPNTGRDLGAFLWHVVTFYDSLDGRYIYTSANLSKHRRRQRLSYLLQHPQYSFHAPSCHHRGYMERQRSSSHNFTLSTYLGANLIPSSVRPYSKWFKQYIGTYDETLPLAYNGIFTTTAANLQKKYISFYRELLTQTELGCDTEVIHFIERAAPLIFG